MDPGSGNLGTEAAITRGQAILASIPVVASGWAFWLGVPPSTPLTIEMTTRIRDYVKAEVLAQPKVKAMLDNPFTGLVTAWGVDNYIRAIETILARLVGGPVSQVPANFGAEQSVRDSNPGTVIADVIGGAARDAGAAAGNIAAHTAVLVAILALILMGLFRIFADSPAVNLVPGARIARALA